jgi:hypothetical protein
MGARDAGTIGVRGDDVAGGSGLEALRLGCRQARSARRHVRFHAMGTVPLRRPPNHRTWPPRKSVVSAPLPWRSPPGREARAEAAATRTRRAGPGAFRARNVRGLVHVTGPRDPDCGGPAGPGGAGRRPPRALLARAGPIGRGMRPAGRPGDDARSEGRRRRTLRVTRRVGPAIDDRRPSGAPGPAARRGVGAMAARLGRRRRGSALVTLVSAAPPGNRRRFAGFLAEISPQARSNPRRAGSRKGATIPRRREGIKMSAALRLIPSRLRGSPRSQGRESTPPPSGRPAAVESALTDRGQL